MSWWSYVHGTIVVSPMGRTQAEKRYILETVLDHLPKVTGSEGPMDVYIIQKKGYNSSCSHTEFGIYGGHLGWDKNNLSLQTQDEYILVVDGALRDRMFDQTFREFQKWLCRLAKRAHVIDVMVSIRDYSKSTMVRRSDYYRMFEDPTWCQDYGIGEPNWCEYLMWDNAKRSHYPMMLAYKYFDIPENDKEVERRLGCHAT